jgi:ABC-type transport system involved in cytochrome c biogenesis permease subunit
MTITALIWAVYAAALVLRRETGLQGRRLAWSLVAGFSLVAFALPLTHFAS